MSNVEKICDSLGCRYRKVCSAYNSMSNITDYDILKQEEDMCDKIWDSKLCKLHENGMPYKNLQHEHMCDFEILNFRYCKNRRQLKKLVEKKCKEYLASIGKERDEDLCCCDHCIHERYLTISADTEDLILNIATLGLDNKINELEVNEI
jgi:hypothetical protein